MLMPYNVNVKLLYYEFIRMIICSQCVTDENCFQENARLRDQMEDLQDQLLHRHVGESHLLLSYSGESTSSLENLSREEVTNSSSFNPQLTLNYMCCLRILLYYKEAMTAV